MKTLHLVLTHKWFDKIKSGEKTKEYREYKPYWNKKFFNNGYDAVRFQKGYTKNPETITFKIKEIRREIGGQNDLNLLDVWVIELGERIINGCDT